MLSALLLCHQKQAKCNLAQQQKYAKFISKLHQAAGATLVQATGNVIVNRPDERSAG